MVVRQPHVLTRERAVEGFVGGGERAGDLRGRAEHETVRGDLGARDDERTCADHRALADAHAIEQRRADPDQRASADATAVQYGAVPHHDLFGDERGIAIADVDDRTVLQVAALADLDAVDVAAQDATEPDAGVVAELDIADDRGPRG